MPKPAITTPAIDARVSPAVVQQDRHVGKHAEQEERFDEHRAEAIFRQRIAEDGAIVRNECRQVEASWRFVQPRKPGIATASATRSIAAGHEEHAAPADEVADHAGAGGAQQIAASWPRTAAGRSRPAAARTGTRSPTTASAIGNTPPAAMPGDHAQGHQHFEVRRQPAASVAMPTTSMQPQISRVLLNMSASAPSTGWTSA